jgi:hypothetical protein
MNSCTIEICGDSVVVSGRGGVTDTSPIDGFIELLYMSIDEAIDLIDFSGFDFGIKKDEKGNLVKDGKGDDIEVFRFSKHDNENSHKSFPALLWSIYEIYIGSAVSTETRKKIVNDLKYSQKYFLDAASVFFNDDSSLIHSKEHPLAKRYLPLYDKNLRVKCNFSFDKDTMKIIDIYYPESIFEACFVFFMYLVKNNKSIRECKHCGKLFANQTGHSIYCSRLDPVTKKRCRDVGAMARYKKSAIQLAYEKSYNKIHTRYLRTKNKYMHFLANNRIVYDIDIENPKIIQGIYDNWQYSASELKENANKNNTSLSEFESSLAVLDMQFKNEMDIFKIKQRIAEGYYPMPMPKKTDFETDILENSNITRQINDKLTQLE